MRGLASADKVPRLPISNTVCVAFCFDISVSPAFELCASSLGVDACLCVRAPLPALSDGERIPGDTPVLLHPSAPGA